MRESEIPDSDAEEQARPEPAEDREEAPELPPDAAEGDALEQRRPGAGEARPAAPGPEVPDADAEEQRRI